MKVEALHAVLDPAQVGEHPALPGVPVARPRDVEQARDLFHLAARERARLVLLGAGSKLGWSVLAAAPDFALSTVALAGVTDFEAGDGTITARAGTTMADLQRVTGAAGLCVTPDVPRPEQATLGGVLAAGSGGADRLARGPGRRHVLGTRVLQLDGHSTRSGGNLVKNVTGYDLHRLYCGSHGSLVLVLEASLRLFPEPEATLVASTTCDELELAVELAAGLGSLRVAPRAVTIENGLQDGTFDLHVVLAGLPEHLELELGRIAPLLRDPRVARGAQAAAQRERLRDLEPDARERPVLHVTSRAARLRPTLGELFEALGPHAGARLVVQPALASLDLAHDFGADEECAATLLRIRRALAPLGASATLRGARPLSSTFAELVADPLRAELTERLRRAYDPAGLLCTRPPLGGLR